MHARMTVDVFGPIGFEPLSPTRKKLFEQKWQKRQKYSYSPFAAEAAAAAARNGRVLIV